MYFLHRGTAVQRSCGGVPGVLREQQGGQRGWSRMNQGTMVVIGEERGGAVVLGGSVDVVQTWASGPCGKPCLGMGVEGLKM